jgi:methyl-accepting chemotaxis protein
LQLTIRSKLYGLGILGLVSAVLVGGAGLRGILLVAHGVEDVTATSSAIRNHMEASMFLDLTRADVSKMLTSTADQQDTAASQLADHQKLLKDRLAAAVSFTRPGDARSALEDESKAVSGYSDQLDKIVSVRHDATAAGPLLGPFLQGYQDLRNSMDSTNDKLQSEATRSEADSDHVVSTSERSIISICCVSSLLLLVIAFSTTRSINQRLLELVARLKEIASGDLTQQLEDHHKDELGEMAEWFNRSIHKLHDTIARVAASAERVSTASQQLRSTVSDTADKARVQQEQAAHVATAMQEMAARGDEVSASSRQAAQSSQEAAVAAKSGGQVVQETLKEIEQISVSTKDAARRVQELGERSKQIGEITGVINDIADQTNLLALNAAIEAARAGDQGRGFAVVADEVRKLAERTTHATSEIADKIKKIQEETLSAVQAMQSGTVLVESGVAKTVKSGAALKEIVRIAGVVENVVTQIATAVAEQNNATSLVNASIDRISGISNDAAQSSQEAAESCSSLFEMAQELKSSVDQFKLGTRSRAKNSGSPRDKEPPRRPASRKARPTEDAAEGVYEVSRR